MSPRPINSSWATVSVVRQPNGEAETQISGRSPRPLLLAWNTVTNTCFARQSSAKMQAHDDSRCCLSTIQLSREHAVWKIVRGLAPLSWRCWRDRQKTQQIKCIIIVLRERESGMPKTSLRWWYVTTALLLQQGSLHHVVISTQLLHLFIITTTSTRVLLI